MGNERADRPAILIIDMVKDNFDEARGLSITPLARRLIDPINRTTRVFRERRWPVVFATDAFHPEDFIFTGRMGPHSLEGTEGAEVIDELEREEGDLWLPKPRFSAFFKTDLEQWLKQRGVTLCAIGGIATNFCVLSTAIDALCSDFKAIILQDCTTAVREELHRQTLDVYRRNALYPLFRVMNAKDLMDELPSASGPAKGVP